MSQASASPRGRAARLLSSRLASHWPFWWAAGVMLLLIQRPLHDPGLWWHLSRGRAVVAGTFFPSRELLALEQAADADWFGGVPFYLAWSLGGIYALAAVPLLAAFGLLIYTRRRPALWSRPAAVLFLPLFLWAVRDGLEPVPRLFDVLGLLVLWRVLASELSLRARLFAVGLTMAAWANLGPCPVWGLLLLAFFAPRETVANRLKFLAVAVLAGMLTPRGIFTWRDAAVLFCPMAFEPFGDLGDHRWSGAFQGEGWLISEIAFAVLWGGWIVRGLFSREDEPVRPVWMLAGRWSVPMLAVLLSRANLPAAGIWILLDVLGRERPSVPVRPPASSRLVRLATAAAAIAVLGLVLIDASGRGVPPNRRWGFGISHEIDPRLLEARLLMLPKEEVIGWAPDERSAGIVSWLRGNVRMADHPERALLGGRWSEHLLLIEDLIGSHRAAYRRDDGTWGGWVPKLSEWKVEFLFIPAEAMAFNEALVKSTWKPGDLDSPTVPYLSTDNPRFARVIVDILQQQSLVEAGPWRPTPEIYAGHGWRFDFVAMLGGGPDPEPAIRQSRLFRSMDLPLAAARALLPVRQITKDRRLEQEFLDGQKDLAYQEWTTFGQASEFRRRVVHASEPSQAIKTEQPAWLVLDPDHQAEAWAEGIDHYIEGHIRKAIEALPRQSDQQHYAAAMLWLELGELERANAEFEHLLKEAESPALKIAAEFWKDQTAAFLDR